MESTSTWGITTTLAYFCDSEYLGQLEKEKTIALEELKIEVFGKYWQDESCHQVLRLIGGMIDAKFVGEIIEYLCQQKGKNNNFMNLFIAAKCLDEVRNRQIIAKTKRIISYLSC
ncbi:hypothetical protein [Limnofasciculus baicalensis]|nr:hypothetical protein [Limnofasciculus baicalensis]